MSIFEYEPLVIPDAEFIVSPSQIYRFYSDSYNWYKETILKEESSFKGNTSTYIGTICHYVYDCVAKKIPVSRSIIETELYDHLNKNPNLDVDYALVKETYPDIVNKVVNEYVIPHTKDNVETEKKVYCKYKDGMYLAGTIDRIEGTVLVDYKTTSKLPKVFPMNYNLQLLTYVYILRTQGYIIDTLRLVYGIKATKTIPVRMIVLEKTITPYDERLISSTLDLIYRSVQVVKQNPELTDLIFKSLPA